MDAPVEERLHINISTDRKMNFEQPRKIQKGKDTF